MIRHGALSLVCLAGLAVPAMAQVTGPSTTQSPYMLAAHPASGVLFTSFASNGNGTSTADEFYRNLDTGVMDYRLLGIPDGQGAFRSEEDVRNGTFTLLVTHELGNSSGAVRAHGSRGATVSQWTVRSNPGQANHLEVLGGRDLIRNVQLWNTTTNQYDTYNSASPMPTYANNILGTGPDANQNGFNRFCSADLAPTTAFSFGSLGTTDRIFMSGEESGPAGRAFASIASGPDAGTTYELPRLGDFSWENSVANPFAQNKTIVVGTDDATPGNIYVYVGNKQATGNVVDRAGLTNGNLYSVTMNNTTVNGSGQRIEDRTNILGNAATGPQASNRFGMLNAGDVTNTTGAGLQALDSQGQMNFARPEDFAWDPSRVARGYFVTTDAFDGNSRLWSMQFDDVANPEAGGNISMLADGAVPGTLLGGYSSASGLSDVRMMDNIAASRFGQVLIQEDVGNNARLGRLWLYDGNEDSMTEIGVSDATRFISGVPGFLTADEETSGIIDAWDTIGPGWWLLNMQAHYNIGAGINSNVQGGQLMAVFIPSTVPAPSAAAMLGLGGLMAARRKRR